MEDYYAILGLDPSASPESIKLAYRRLAREHHPDRNNNSPESEKSAQSLHMAQLNAAYAVLSDPAQRREYDEQSRILSTLSGSVIANGTRTVTMVGTATVRTPTKPKASQRVVSSDDADLTLARDFAKQLRSNLLANRKGFSWKEIALEGFDWGLECVSWTTHYCVAARGFAILDPIETKKIVNYSNVVFDRFSRSIRKSHFLFLIPFQHLSQWGSVSVELNRLCSSDSHGRRLAVPVGVVLFDSRMGRTLRIGSRLKEKHFEELLKCLGSELMNSQ